MPVGGGSSNGPVGTVAQLPIIFNTIVFAGVGSQATLELATDNLPGINVWLLQTLGAGNVTAQIQFGDGIVPILGGTDWQPLVAAYGLVLLTPSLVNHRLGSNVHRVLLTSTGVATVRYRLTASLT